MTDTPNPPPATGSMPPLANWLCQICKVGGSAPPATAAKQLAEHAVCAEQVQIRVVTMPIGVSRLTPAEHPTTWISSIDFTAAWYRQVCLEGWRPVPAGRFDGLPTSVTTEVNRDDPTLVDVWGYAVPCEPKPPLPVSTSLRSTS